jgi:glutathione S-transferase
MLTIYHLKASHSTRIIWTAEELGIAFRLESFERKPTYETPAEFCALHPLARAPMTGCWSRVSHSYTGAIRQFNI